MTFSWKDYYELAKRYGVDASVPGEALSDALFRSSISRAYYSAFNLAVVYAETLGYVYDKSMGGRHEALINFLGNRSDADCKRLSMLLDTCKDFRRVADYLADIPDTYHDLNRMKDQTITRVEDVFVILSV